MEVLWNGRVQLGVAEGEAEFKKILSGFLARWLLGIHFIAAKSGDMVDRYVHTINIFMASVILGP
jgi:hypothetical protein